MASVSQHVCNVPFMHITHISLWSSTASSGIQQHRQSVSLLSPVGIYASIFLTVFAKRTSEPQLNPRLRTHRFEVPQFEITLGSMNLLSSTLNFYFGMRISSAGHRYVIHFSEHRGELWTIGCTRGSSVELSVHAASQPVADWKCLHLIFAMLSL